MGVVEYSGKGSPDSTNGIRFKRCEKERKEGLSCSIKMNSEDEIGRIDDYSSIYGVYIVRINSP